MPTFILTINWTDQGIRAVRYAPKRSKAARELAQKVGVEIKQVYLTSGEHDILLRVRARDAVDLRDVVLTRLQEIPEVRATQTVLIFEEAEPGHQPRA